MGKKLEIIKINEDQTLTFGNYEVVEKQKVTDFEYKGEKLAVKTHKEITVLKMNDNLVIETVPGTVIENFAGEEGSVSFDIKGYKQTIVTLGVKPEVEYNVYIDGVKIDILTSKASGKASFSLDVENVKKSVLFERA